MERENLIWKIDKGGINWLMVNWSVDLNYTFESDRLVNVKCKMLKPYNDNVA